MRIPFPLIAYTHDDLCRKIRDYIQSFGKGCRIIRRAEFLEEIRYHHFSEKSLRDGFPEDAPVVMYQLRKEYPGSGGNPPHVAVETISLAIQRNECFGLLGPNGMELK